MVVAGACLPVPVHCGELASSEVADAVCQPLVMGKPDISVGPCLGWVN